MREKRKFERLGFKLKSRALDSLEGWGRSIRTQPWMETHLFTPVFRWNGADKETDEKKTVTQNLWACQGFKLIWDWETSLSPSFPHSSSFTFLSITQMSFKLLLILPQKFPHHRGLLPKIAKAFLERLSHLIWSVRVCADGIDPSGRCSNRRDGATLKESEKKKQFPCLFCFLIIQQTSLGDDAERKRSTEERSYYRPEPCGCFIFCWLLNINMEMTFL